MASYIFHGVGSNPSKAFADVLIRNDATIELKIGITDIGGGSATALGMIAAEELGVELDDVKVIYGDTSSTPYGPGSHSSRIIPEVGPAALQAGADARRKLLELVASQVNADPNDLRVAGGVISSISDRNFKMRFKDACALVVGPEGLFGRGSRSPSPGGHPFPYPIAKGGGEAPPVGPYNFATFGACAVEIEVDLETAEIRILKAATAHEFGKALNPKFCDSQHYGGVAMGVGSALLEEPIIDKKTGIMLNADLHQYRMPTALDMPLECVPINIEGEDRFFAYSAKGGGEGMNTAVPAAIRNAIYNATGLWMNEYPISRNRLLAALTERRVKEAATSTSSSSRGSEKKKIEPPALQRI